MTDDRFSILRKGLDRAKDAIGGLTGDRPIQGRDKVDGATGAMQAKVGVARGQIQALTGEIASYTRARPLIAVGVLLGTGVLLGLLAPNRSWRRSGR